MALSWKANSGGDMKPAGAETDPSMLPNQSRLALSSAVDGPGPFGQIPEVQACGLANETEYPALFAAEVVRDAFRIATDRALELVHVDPSRHDRARNLDGLARTRPLKIVVVENESELGSHVRAWQDLADHAMEANVFYEPWLLRPALRTLTRDQPLRLVFIYEQEPLATAGVSRLCGFFPLEPVSRYQNLPIRAWRMWKHVHCFLCTPLLRRDRARDTLAALLQWARASAGAHVVDFSSVRGDGPFHDLLREHAEETGAWQCVTNRYARALWKQGRKFEDYLQNTLSTGVRKEYRRQRRRLAELGSLEFRTLQNHADLDDWLDTFLDLEASGWKAREGTALGINASERAYVREAAREGFARRQMVLQGLFLDGRAAAMLLSFLSGSGGFAFKIAYDENLAKFSPGVQIMLDVMGYLHSNSRLAWMDSCAEPDHPMINRLWKDHKIIESVLCSTGHWLGDLAIMVYPAGRPLLQIIRGFRP